jgi:hypothetical protein
MHAMLSAPALSPTDIGRRGAAGLIQLSDVDAFLPRCHRSGESHGAGRTRGKGLLGKLEKRRGAARFAILDKRSTR